MSREEDTARLWSLKALRLHGFSTSDNANYILHDKNSAQIDFSQTLETHPFEYRLRLRITSHIQQCGTLLILPLSQILNIRIYSCVGQGRLEFRIATPRRGSEVLRQAIAQGGPARVYAPDEDDQHHFLSMIKYGRIMVDVEGDVLEWTRCLKSNAVKGWEHVIDVVIEDDKGRLHFLDDENMELRKDERKETQTSSAQTRSVPIERSEGKSADDQRRIKGVGQDPMEPENKNKTQEERTGKRPQANGSRVQPLQNQITDRAGTDLITAIIKRRKLDDEESEFKVHDDTPIMQENSELPSPPPSTRNVSTRPEKPSGSDTNDSQNIQEKVNKQVPSGPQQPEDDKRQPSKPRRPFASQQEEYKRSQASSHLNDRRSPYASQPPSSNRNARYGARWNSRPAQPIRRNENIPRRSSTEPYDRPPPVRSSYSHSEGRYHDRIDNERKKNVWGRRA
jgi:hypothetical protein